MSGHTPTPWEASNQWLYADDRTLPIASGQAEWVTNLGGPLHQEARANAAFIVKAVNNHDALLLALKEVRSISQLELNYPTHMRDAAFSRLKKLCDFALKACGEN